MAVREIRLNYDEFDSISECPVEIQELYKMACEAAEKAYAPFSKFKVGVAMELGDGSRYTANNQENKAYPSGLCAERTGLFYVNSLKPEVPIEIMVLVAFDQDGMIKNPVYPCGACRQVMMESQERGHQAIQTWMIGSNKIHKIDSVEVLLPLKFSF